MLVALALALGDARSALAQEWDGEPDEPYNAATWPVELVHRPLTPAAGMWEIGLLANANLTAGDAGKPISLAPGVVYGVTDRVALGLEHVRGICLSGIENGCPYIYNDAAALIRWAAVRRAPWEVVVRGGFAAQFEPEFGADALLRAGARWRWREVALLAEPFINVALTDREVNRTFIGVTGRAEAQATRRLAAYALFKLFGVVDDFGRTYLIHSGIGLLVGLGRVDVGGQIVFPALLGPNDFASAGLGRLDQREVQLFVTARF